jgi:hypothetical protein
VRAQIGAREKASHAFCRHFGRLLIKYTELFDWRLSCGYGLRPSRKGRDDQIQAKGSKAMSRNLKALGLALLAAFALSAVMVSAASAHTPAKFTSGSDWTILHSRALTAQVFKEGSIEVSCSEVGVDGSTAETAPTSLTVEPTYGVTTDTTGATQCKLKTPTEFDAQVHSNGCKYVFAAGGETDGTVSITCPEGKSIEVTADILGKWRPCLDIGAQAPGTPTVDYTNGTEVTEGKNVWDVTVKSTVKKIGFTKTGLCGSGAFTEAEYSGEVTVWGTDTAGKAVDVTWDPTVK